MVHVINVPVDDMIAKITEKAGLSEEELNRKIRQKMDQLAGLISREGALHIIANEHGVKLYDEQGGRLKVRSLLAGMRNAELLARVIDIYEIREFQSGERKGKVASLLVGDETGKMRLVLWGGQTDRLAGMKKEDVILVRGAYVKENLGRRELHLGDAATLLINPEGESIAPLQAQAASATRKGIAELQDNDQDVEIFGTIVQAYNLNFFDICPQCNKRARTTEQGSLCELHGRVTPNTSYVFNVFLDDGSGNIRTVFFRNQVNNLLEKQADDMLQYRTAPEAFEQVKHDLLGRMIKVIGRVTRNAMFDRLEFIAQRVYPQPQPEEELQRLAAVEKETPTKQESPASRVIMPVMAPAMSSTPPPNGNSFLQVEEESISNGNNGGDNIEN